MANAIATLWTQLLLKTLLILFALYVMIRWFEHHQVFHPSQAMEATGAALERPWEDIFFEAPDGVRLNAWYFPSLMDKPSHGRVILLCHGNAGNISHRLHHADALLSTGVSLLLFDYRGYGQSEGRPSEEGTYLDVEAAWQWLRDRGFAAENIVVLGESLGGGVASQLASRRPLGGLILLSTFTSVSDVAGEMFPWLPTRWLGRIQYNTTQRLPEIDIPILICHSRTDGMIGFHHAQKNFQAAQEPKRLVEIQGTHNDWLWTDREGYLQAIRSFLDSLPNPAGDHRVPAQQG